MENENDSFERVFLGKVEKEKPKIRANLEPIDYDAPGSRVREMGV